MIRRIKEKLKVFKNNLLLVFYSYKDLRNPKSIRVYLFVLLLYALSPVDLIPDFIPVLGLVDDMLILPAGIWVALKLISPEVIRDARISAQQHQGKLDQWDAGFIFILFVWSALVLFTGKFLFK